MDIVKDKHTKNFCLTLNVLFNHKAPPDGRSALVAAVRRWCQAFCSCSTMWIRVASHRLHSRGLSIRPDATFPPSSYCSFVIWVTLRCTATQLTPKSTTLLTNSQLHRVHYLNQFKHTRWLLERISPRFNIDDFLDFAFLLLWKNSSWLDNNVVTALMLSHIQRWTFLF